LKVRREILKSTFPLAEREQGMQGELMVVLPLSKRPEDLQVDPSAPEGSTMSSQVNWLKVTSAATLVTGGALLLAGKHRAGLVAAIAGTSLAVIDQQDSMKKWWFLLPNYITQVQGVLTHIEEAVDQFAKQRDKIGSVLGR
jgi:hypothetical protein